jgi:hypothetical protein
MNKKLSLIENKVSEPVMTQSYSKEELTVLRDKFDQVRRKASELYCEAYAEYLQLIGLTQDEAYEYVESVDGFNEVFPLVEKMEEVDNFFDDLIKQVA